MSTVNYNRVNYNSMLDLPRLAFNIKKLFLFMLYLLKNKGVVLYINVLYIKLYMITVLAL